ncbi:ankyrin repeat and death domain-containing protein 1A isoform X6 [Corvus moneduloides]|uniref:ankyrin repeat and death domain-containing protein 1A isoform X6 n=1 Tax=Corvus moneduloides TaxID=1196302 RepID=UPI001363A618|nr:ankyrin repeat and death domain-containing protein 1A isoform X6 [Corvus moneduloides]
MGDDLASEGDTLLQSEKEFHDAVKRNDTARMEELIRRGVDIKAKNNTDRTALHWAAGAGNVDAVRLLLDHDVPVDDEDSVQRRPLHFGMNALLLSAWFGHLQVLHILISAGAKISCVNRHGMNLLHCAAQRGHIQVMEFIVQDLEDVCVDETDKMDRTAFHLAAEYGQLEVVEFLIQLGCSHSAKDKEENTALHLAAKNGHFSVLEKIIDVGVDLDEKNLEGLTALHLAAEGGHSHCVKLLVEAGADVNAQTQKKMSCLHYAALHGYEEIARLLLDAGIHVDALNHQNASATHIAVLQNFPAMLKLFISAECDLDIPDNRQQTSLHIAAEHGRQDIAEMILIAGVNLKLTDKQGKTSLDVAARGNHINLVDMIIRADRFYKWEKKVSGKKQTQTPPLHGSAQQCNTRSILSGSQLQEKHFSAAERRQMQPKGFLSHRAGTAAAFWTGNGKGKTNAHGQKWLYTEGRSLPAISYGLGTVMRIW